MKEEKELQQENKSDKIRLKMTIAIIILAALFIVELYLMMNYSESYLFLGIIGLVMLCLVYLIIDITFKIRNDGDASHVNEYESIYKAQKVSYVSMKQSFLDIERTLDRIRENSEVPTEELIQAQKAVGKVTIKRNKENAVAIMNSNEKMIESINAFENKMNDFISSLNQSDDETGTDFNFQEITDALANMQEDIKSKISAISSNIEAGLHVWKDEIIKEVDEKITSANAEVMQRVSEISLEPVIVEKPVFLTEPAVPAESAPSEPVVQAEPAVSADSVVQNESKMPTDSVAEEEPGIAADPVAEEEPGIDSDPVVQELPEMSADPVKQEEPGITTDPVVQEESEMAADTVVQEVPNITEEPVVQGKPEKAADSVIQEESKIAADPVIQNEPNVTAEPVIQEEPKITAKPAVQEKPLVQKPKKTAEPVAQGKTETEKESLKPEQMAQPGKQMSQEEPKEAEVNLESGKNMTPGEIADLLSEINEKPEPEPEIEEKDTTSNLGHVMTPEEIAALLADM